MVRRSRETDISNRKEIVQKDNCFKGGKDRHVEKRSEREEKNRYVLADRGLLENS